MKSFLIRLTVSLVFLGAMILLLSRTLQWKDVTSTFLLFSWFSLGSAVAIAFCVSFLKAVRFYLLVKRTGLVISFWDTCKLFFASQAASPLPAGETVRGALLRNETGGSVSQVSGPVLVQALIEMIASALLILAGSLFFPTFRWIAFVFFFFLIGLLLFVFQTTGVKRMLTPLTSWKHIGPKLAGALKAQQEVHDILLTSRKKVSGFAFKILILGLATDVVGGALIFFLAHQLNASLLFSFAIFLYAVSVGIQGALTIIPGGLGVTEGGMLGLLAVWSVPLAQAIPLVVSFRVVTLLFPILLGLILLLVFYAKPWFWRTRHLSP